jgi:hypothetical protein
MDHATLWRSALAFMLLSCGGVQRGNDFQEVQNKGLPFVTGQASNDCTCTQWKEKAAHTWDGFQVVSKPVATHLRLQYMAPEAKACLATGPDARICDSTTILLIRSAAQSEEYVLRIPRSLETFAQANIAPGDLERAIQEIVEGDTIGCAFAHVEASVDQAPDLTVVLGFDRVPDDKDRVVVIRNIQGCFGEDLRFEFEKGMFKAYRSWLDMVCPEAIPN